MENKIKVVTMMQCLTQESEAQEYLESYEKRMNQRVNFYGKEMTKKLFLI